MNPNSKMTTKKRIVVLLFLGVGVILFYNFLSGIDAEELYSHISNAKVSYIALSVLVGVVAYLLRALRWVQVLSSTGHKVSVMDSLIAINWGYLYNVLIPRSGEALRVVYLSRTTDVPVSKGIGTVISERVVDLLCMSLVLGITLGLKYESLTTVLILRESIADVDWDTLIYLIIASCVVGLVVVGVIYKFRKALAEILIGLKQGLLAVFALRKPWLYILYTVGIWGCYVLMTFIFFYVFEQTAGLTLSDSFFVLSMGALGLLAPTNAGIGAYHYMIKLALVLLTISDSVAIAFVTLMHLSHTLIPFVMVLPFLAINKLLKNRTNHAISTY